MAACIFNACYCYYPAQRESSVSFHLSLVLLGICVNYSYRETIVQIIWAYPFLSLFFFLHNSQNCKSTSTFSCVLCGITFRNNLKSSNSISCFKFGRIKVTVWYIFQVKLNLLLKCLSWQNWHSISNVLWYSNRCFLIILGEIKNFVTNLVFSCSEQEELNHQFLCSFLHLFSSLILLSSRRRNVFLLEL